MSFTLITGASSGIGLELAYIFAEKKHNLILTARSADKLFLLKNTLEKKFNIQVEVFPMDLTLPQAAKELFNLIKTKQLTVNRLINNAGFGDLTEFSKSQLQSVLDMIQLNITSLVELTHLFLPDLKNTSGKILNVASIGSFMPGPYMAVYYATKAFVLSFSEALAAELKSAQVSVTALCPGPTETGFQDRAQFSNNAVSRFFKLATAKDVALYGYQSLENDTVVAISGFSNRFLAFIIRLLPRAVVRHCVLFLQKKRALNKID